MSRRFRFGVGAATRAASAICRAACSQSQTTSPNGARATTATQREADSANRRRMIEIFQASFIDELVFAFPGTGRQWVASFDGKACRWMIQASRAQGQRIDIEGGRPVEVMAFDPTVQVCGRTTRKPSQRDVRMIFAIVGMAGHGPKCLQHLLAQGCKATRLIDAHPQHARGPTVGKHTASLDARLESRRFEILERVGDSLQERCIDFTEEGDGHQEFLRCLPTSTANSALGECYILDDFAGQ